MFNLHIQQQGQSMGVINSPVVPRVGEIIVVPAKEPIRPDQIGSVPLEVEEVQYEVSATMKVEVIIIHVKGYL